MTKRLYREDPYRTEFESQIIERLEIDGKTGLILEETLFYPTSGGQLHDTGLINDVKVIDVIEKDRKIIHIVEKNIIGESGITGKVDWNRRFDHMQQHTGQHILSQSLIRLFNTATVSSYLGNDFSTIDIEKESFSEVEANTAEIEANNWVFKNVLVNILYPDETEALNMPLRKTPPPGKRTRIVNIEGYDHSPCGGTHCSRTGEVGIIKILKWGRMRGNIRLDFYCGQRALADYRNKNCLINTIKSDFSVNEDGIIEKLTKLEEENKDLRKFNSELNLKLIDSKAVELYSEADSVNNVKIIHSVFEDLEIKNLQNIAKKIAENGDSVVILGSSGDKPSFVFLHSGNIDLNLQKILNNQREQFDIKGGGSSSMVQGGLQENSALLDFIKASVDIIYKELQSL